MGCTCKFRLIEKFVGADLNAGDISGADINGDICGVGINVGDIIG